MNFKNNKFSFIAAIKAEDRHKSLSKKVRYEINKYLHNVDCFMLMQGTDSLIFGGAVRDSIAGLDIHDIDIVVLPQAFKLISERLSAANFQKMSRFTLDLSSLYSNTQIHEPHSWINKEGKTVQLIRPVDVRDSGNDPKGFLYNFVKNVDISCCGVSFFPNEMLVEHIKNAIDDCFKKQFHIIESAKLYNHKRVFMRVNKLQKRGWIEYKMKEEKSICNDCCNYIIGKNKCTKSPDTCQSYEKVLPFY